MVIESTTPPSYAGILDGGMMQIYPPGFGFRARGADI